MKKYILALLSLVMLSTSIYSQVTFTETPFSNPSYQTSREDCVTDLNGDHLDDILRTTNDTLYFDFQLPNGSFEHKKVPLTLVVRPEWSLCAGDFDGNGYTDFVMGGGTNVSIVTANGDGTVYSEDNKMGFIFCQRTSIADIDNDGDLDLFVCNDIGLSQPYRNDGNGNLTLDQDLLPTADLHGNYQSLFIDYNNDRLIDLYITKCLLGSTSGDIERTNLLYHNNGDGTFTEVGEDVGLNDNSQSWMSNWEDFDNDGDLDVFIVNHDTGNKFMVNDGTGHFTDQILSTGIDRMDLGARESLTGDFDNDGDIDIFSQLSDELYDNNGDGTFSPHDLPFNDGAIGDVNDDGFLDIVHWNSININDGNNNNWIKVSLEGKESNIHGIGSRVEIYGDWGVQVREVRTGESYSSMSSWQVHFGVGTQTEIDSVLVYWPSGKWTRVDNPVINETLVIEEHQTSSNNEPDLVREMSVYPLPVTDVMYVEFESFDYGLGEMNIYSIDGKLLSSESIHLVKGAMKMEVNVEGLSGSFIISIESHDKKIAKKIISF